MKTEEISSIPTDGIFIYVGRIPQTNDFTDLGIINSSGYIPTNEKLETTIPGILQLEMLEKKK